MEEKMIRSFWKGELRILPGEIPKILGLIPYNSQSEDLGGFHEIIKPGAFKRTLDSGGKVLGLWAHDHSKPLASTENGTLRLNDSGLGLEVEMDLDTNVTWSNDAYRSVKSGTLSGLSFGFSLPPGGDVWTDGGSIREIHDAKLLEISPVSFPAYPSSEVMARNKNNMHEEDRKMQTARAKSFWRRDTRQDTRQDTSRGFSCTRDFLMAVMNTGTVAGVTRDPRLQRAATGLGETPASDGGFLLPSNLIDSLLFGDDASSLLNLCDKYTITQGNSATFPGTDEQTRVTGSQLGGLSCSWGQEAGTIGYVNPTLNALNLDLKKLKCYIPVTDELFESGPLAEKFLKNVGRRSLAYAISEAIYRGSGVGMPLGVLHAPATITVDKDAGQSAGTLSASNCRELVAHLPPESLGRDSLCFLMNPELFEQALTLAVGTGGSGSGIVTYDNQGLPRIMGVKVFPWQFCSAPGDRGDILVGDFSQYVWLDRKIRQSVSIHVLYDTDQSVFRLVYRCDGQPAWSKSVIPTYSSAGRRISPFVTLQERV